jgi:hypothetical protein
MSDSGFQNSRSLIVPAGHCFTQLRSPWDEPRSFRPAADEKRRGLIAALLEIWNFPPV